jgi:UDP-glucose 4-epimerase
MPRLQHRARGRDNRGASIQDRAMSVLVTGGAGYIGSHMAHTLVEHGEKVVILDNLSTGLQRLAPPRPELFTETSATEGLVSRILREHEVDCVIHFAGSTVVPDSVRDPLTYYANNTISSRELISPVSTPACNISSSRPPPPYMAQPICRSLDENAETSPTNPYGRSKLATEWILQDAAAASSMRYVALRYFNVAGADPLGRTGQSTPRATHLIKRACQAALGQHRYLDIFGVDFPTHDGTGVRDYIHVSDLGVGPHAGAWTIFATTENRLSSTAAMGAASRFGR